MDLVYPLSTAPQQFQDTGRRCGMWICNWVRTPVIIDTAALDGDELKMSGPDTFPPDCLLVVVDSREAERLRRAAAKLPYPTSGPAIAAQLIDAECVKDSTLRARLRW